MPGKSRIVGPHGKSVKVGREGELNVSVHAHPPLVEEDFPLPFFQYLTDDGTESGIEDMRVDGSTTNVDYYIENKSTSHIYITGINVMIQDASATLNKFGNLTALTNGLEFFYETGLTGRVVIGEAIKDNITLIRLSGGDPAFGDATSAFKMDISGGGADAYMANIDLDEIFGLVYGLKLRPDTNDRIGFSIRDDLSTGIDSFDAYATGFTMVHASELN